MVIHDCKQHRFLIERPEGSSYMEYTLSDSTVTVIHTAVPKALAGQGLAGELALSLSAWAKKEELTLLSDCSYMTHWLSRKSS